MQVKATFQGLRDQIKELEAYRDSVLEKCAPLEKERDAAHREVAQAQEKARKVGEKIVALKTDEYRDACNMIAALHRALGARSLSRQ